MKTVITVSREWHNPEIKTVISNDAISLCISMEDFIKALSEEIGNPLFLMTRANMKAKLDEAVMNVMEKVKAESAKVM